MMPNAETDHAVALAIGWFAVAIQSGGVIYYAPERDGGLPYWTGFGNRAAADYMGMQWVESGESYRPRECQAKVWAPTQCEDHMQQAEQRIASLHGENYARALLVGYAPQETPGGHYWSLCGTDLIFNVLGIPLSQRADALIETMQDVYDA